MSAAYIAQYNEKSKSLLKSKLKLNQRPRRWRRLPTGGQRRGGSGNQKCHDWLIDGLFMKNQCGGVKAVHLQEDGCPAGRLPTPLAGRSDSNGFFFCTQRDIKLYFPAC